MSQSKLPIYAYIDETGNTGHNLFDIAQPDFFTAALISKGDFDIAHGSTVQRLAHKLGTDALHGRELGFGGLEKSAKTCSTSSGDRMHTSTFHA